MVEFHQENPGFLPLNMGVSGFNFPINQSNETMIRIGLPSLVGGFEDVFSHQQ